MRKLVITLAVAIILFIAVLAYLLYSPVNTTRLNAVQRWMVGEVNKKWAKLVNAKPAEVKSIVNYDELMASLNYLENQVVSQILAINPAQLGFKGPFFSKTPAKSLTQIPSVIISAGPEKIETGVQYLPAHVLKDFEAMQQAMRADIGKRLLVDSGYRSPGRQLQLFFKYLEESHDYSLLETAKWVAMPGYSEHNSPITTAIDLINQDGINGDDRGQKPSDFEALPEYRWLQAHAARFNFYLSYPPGNPHGITFEPWHWHWQGHL